MLERHGFTVITADGDVAAEVASRHPELDLCIMDYNMPTMNGLEAMHHIRKLEAHTGLPIFILTTESADSLAQDGLEQARRPGLLSRGRKSLPAGIKHYWRFVTADLRSTRHSPFTLIRVKRCVCSTMSYWRVLSD